MYNRYVRNDRGGYSRVPVDESPQEERNGGFPPPFQSAEGPSEGRGGQDHSDGPPPRHSGWETEEERRVFPAFCAVCWTAFIWKKWTAGTCFCC
mgnify:CR=1 FL=1